MELIGEGANSMTMFFKLRRMRVKSFWICAAISSILFNSACASAQDATTIETSLVQQAAEQNLGVPTLDNTYAVDRASGQQPGVQFGPGQHGLGSPFGGGLTDDPYDGNEDIPKSEFDQTSFSLGDFLADPGLFFSKLIKQFFRDVIRPLARKLSALLLLFVLNPNIAADGLKFAKNDVQKLFNQTADVMFYIAIDLSLIFFVLAVWRYWSDSAWRGRSGTWMSAVGRLIFTIGLLLLWKSMYTLELDITNEMIKAVWFNDPAQRELLVSTIEKVFAAALGAGGGITLASFAPFMGALGGSVVGGPVGMVIGGAGGSIIALLGWLLFIVFGVVIITEIVYFLVLKAIQEALLAAQFLVGYIFLVCFASPDTEHMATGFVRSFIEVSLWSFVWLILLKVLCIVLNASNEPSGAQILLVIGVLQIMIQVPAFMGRAQISPVSEFLTAGAVTGLVSKGLGSATDSIKKVMTDVSEYQLNAKYAAVGTPETSATMLTMPSSAKDRETYTAHRAVTQAGASQLTPPVPPSSTKTGAAADPSKVGASQLVPTSSASGGGAADANSMGVTPPSTATLTTDSGKDADSKDDLPLPPAKKLVTSGTANADDGAGTGTDIGTGTGSGSGPGAAATVAASAGADKIDNGDTNSASLSHPAGQPGSGSLASTSSKDLNTAIATAHSLASSAPPAADSDQEDAAQVETAQAAAAQTTQAQSSPRRLLAPRANTGLLRTQSRVYANARIRPWVQDLNDGENMARFGTDEQAKIHMGERGSRMVEYSEGASEEEMGLTVAVAGMSTDLANNPRGRDAARRAVISRHMDQPKSLAEHIGAAALYTAKGSFFSQTKLGQSRGKLGMLDETVAGTAHYLTLGEAGHENEVTTQLTETFGEYTPERQAGTIGQMTDENSSESGLNRATGMATRTLVSHGLQINDVARAVFASRLVSGQRIGQRHMGDGVVKYIEGLSGKHATQMSNIEAQPYVDAITPEEAYACMVIARAEGADACQNVELVKAVASMGRGSNQSSYEAGLGALENQLSRVGAAGGAESPAAAPPASIAAAPPAAIAAAYQSVQRLHRAGFNDSHLADPEVVDVEDNLRQQAGGVTSPSLVQAVLGSDTYAAEKKISPAHIAEQVLKRNGVQSNQRSRDVVVQMLDEGYDPAEIDRDSIMVADKIMDHGGGHPTRSFVELAQQSPDYSSGSAHRLSNSTVAKGLVANATEQSRYAAGPQVPAARALLENHVNPELIDMPMIDAAIAMRANGVPTPAMKEPTMVAARQLLMNSNEPGLLTLDNLNAAKYISDEHLNKESVVTARRMLDEPQADNWRFAISNEEMYVGKGLVANNISPAPEIVQQVINHPEYRAQAYAEGVTPASAKAVIPQSIIDDYGWYGLNSAAKFSR